jgi:membrane protein required for colicin V production
MGIFDVILILILSGFVFYGLFFGLIRTFGAFAGVFIGAYLASRFYLPVFDYIERLSFGYPNLGKVFVFIILFSLINRLVGFGFYFLDKAFNVISIIPFLKTVNRLAGAILGFLTGALILGLLIYVSSRYAFIDNWFGQWLVNSQVVPFVSKFSNLLIPFLPEMLKKLHSLL